MPPDPSPVHPAPAPAAIASTPARISGRRGGGFWRWVGFAVCLLALVPLALWTIGRVLSDRGWGGYTQFIAWVPSWALILPALLLVLLGLPARRRRADGRRAWVLSSLHTLVALWALIAVTHFALVEIKLYRALRGTPPEPSAGLRLLHWNGVMPDTETFSGPYADLTARLGRLPDALFLTTSQPRDLMMRSAASLPGYHLAYAPPFTVLSRYPILHSRLFSLELNKPGGPTEVEPAQAAAARAGEAVAPGVNRPARAFLVKYWNRYAPMIGLPRRRFPQGESGYVMPVTLDTTPVLGRPITVWFIDLPSDPFVLRWEIADAARRRFVDLMAQTDPGTGRPLLPAPDVIVGDTNIPRGSASLALLYAAAPGAEGAGGAGWRDAYDDAGWGLSSTWPRNLPLLHIDHTFLSPRLRATSYRVGEPPVSDHWFELVDIQGQ